MDDSEKEEKNLNKFDKSDKSAFDYELEESIKQLISLKLLMAKPNIVDENGKEISISQCKIETEDIKRLVDKVDPEMIEAGKVNPEALVNHFSVPLITPTGGRIDLAVENQEVGIQAEMETIEGKEESIFLLQDKVDEMIPYGLENTVNMEEYNRIFKPKNVTELSQALTKNGKLIPESKSEAVQMATKEGLGYGKEKEYDKALLKIKEPEIEEDEEEKTEEVDSIPEEYRDEITKICEEKGLRKSQLKQVLIVPASSVVEHGDNTGVRADGGNVIMFRFKDASLVDKVVTYQNGKALSNTSNDERYSQLMETYHGKEAKNLENEKDSKIYYTDLDGNTYSEDIVRTPNDLTEIEKEEFKKQWEELERESDEVLNADIPAEEKGEEYQAINDRKIELGEKYNVPINIIETQIIEDKEETQEKTQETNKEDDEDDRYNHYPEYGERRGPFDVNKWTNY